MKIVLASTSPFRKSMLEKLRIPFTTAKPQVDESPLQGESAIALVERLAIAKAKAIADTINDGWVIGSDQVATIDGEILGKPHHHDNAIKQLQLCSGKTVRFVTGLCLYNAATKEYQALVEPFDVKFRSLTEQQIELYLQAEQPYNCAGSFKSEGLGICLFEALQGKDPNTLIGLPLISLITLFAEQQIDLLEYIQ
ncbi:Maf family protein [Neptunicella sp. SCSIO 80796]|uniref:Maf family protein n=1 Tax=Neptunicella plasticusilytica TaxID=3117012 RepID=UPI003A4DE5FD